MVVVTNSELLRAKMRTRLDEIIHDIKSSTNVEIGVYNYTIREATEQNIAKRWSNAMFCELYLMRMRSILYNITPELVKSVDPPKLSQMNHYEWCPDKWADMIHKRDTKYTLSLTNTSGATTTDFKCFKCQKNNCTYYQMQTRSADEPMTTFVTCVNCEIHWRC